MVNVLVDDWIPASGRATSLAAVPTRFFPRGESAGSGVACSIGRFLRESCLVFEPTESRESRMPSSYGPSGQGLP